MSRSGWCRHGYRWMLKYLKATRGCARSCSCRGWRHCRCSVFTAVPWGLRPCQSLKRWPDVPLRCTRRRSRAGSGTRESATHVPPFTTAVRRQSAARSRTLLPWSSCGMRSLVVFSLPYQASKVGKCHGNSGGPHRCWLRSLPAVGARRLLRLTVASRSLGRKGWRSLWSRYRVSRPFGGACRGSRRKLGRALVCPRDRTPLALLARPCALAAADSGAALRPQCTELLRPGRRAR